MKLTRGERNNNPGNIDRNDIKWRGMAADQSTDSRFVVFTAPIWGIRAIAKVLKAYYHSCDLHTVRQVIDKWAPPVENNTEAYIQAVAHELATTADTKIDIDNAIILAALVKAIIRHENGAVPYEDSTIAKAIALI